MIVANPSVQTRAALLVAFLLGAACVPALPNAGTETGETGGPTLEANYELCSCASELGAGWFQCETAEVCPEIQADLWPDAIANPDAVDCAIEALAAAEPGVLHWSFYDRDDPGPGYSRQGRIEIREDGSAARILVEVHDAQMLWSAVEYGYIRSDISACATGDSLARFDCMAEALESVAGECQPSGQHGD
jgi:hypothetical protein